MEEIKHFDLISSKFNHETKHLNIVEQCATQERVTISYPLDWQTGKMIDDVVFTYSLN
jgi:hypothetical protein